MARLHDLSTRNFLRNLATTEDSLFVTPWAGVIVRNSDSNGNLIEHNTINSYIESKIPVWLYLKLKIFKDEHELYGAFVCPTCESMTSVLMMTMDQRRADIENILCHHSVAVEHQTDWRDVWGEPDDIDIGTLSHNFLPNIETKVLKLIKKDIFLAAVQSNGNVHLIFTLSKLNTAPFCSKCSTRKCVHYKQFKNHEANKNIGNIGNIDNLNNSNHSGASSTSSSRSSSSPSSGHYDEVEAQNKYNHKYGNNFNKIIYPFKMDPETQAAWTRRLDGQYDLPEEIKPEFIEGFSCTKHKSTFDPNDDKMVQNSKNIIIYTETSERIYNIVTFARKTIGGCKCRQQADTHSLLLWHVGKGKMIDYMFLSCALHNMRANGTPKNGLLRARSERLNSIGVKTSLTYQTFSRAANGFVSRLEFHPSLKTFSCPKCGTAPKYLVADGKSCGPTKRKTQHLHELGTADADEECLVQGSFYKDRVFLPDFRERQAICQVLTDSVSIEEFLADPNIESENGRMVLALFIRNRENWMEEIPIQYKRFIANICKQSSVAGLLQVTSDRPLSYLELFCQEELDIRSTTEVDKLTHLQEQIPAFWPMITNILDLEGSKYLSQEIQPIVRKLIQIRRNTFINATSRSDDDYTDWPNPMEEDGTQFYPEFPIFRFPKRYTVSGQKDVDYCNKAFNEKRDFSYGVFSIGCGCDLNITYGFELMLAKESAHNLFRFLMCRDVDLRSLEGIIFDHACGLDAFILNREPREFEYLRCLVDGSHWQGHKKLKKPDKSGNGGHIGCSESFNFNIYKEYLPGVSNSQGREQTHSEMEAVVESLGQMNYRNYMHYMRVFFGLTNLKHRGII